MRALDVTSPGSDPVLVGRAGMDLGGRVVLFGPALSGKSTLLKAFARAVGFTVDSSDVPLGEPVEHDLVTDHGLPSATVSIPAFNSSLPKQPYRDPHRGAGAEPWPTFRTRFDDAASMRAPLEYLVR